MSVLTYAREHLWIRDHPAGLRGARTPPDELNPVVQRSGINTSVCKHEPEATAGGGRCKSLLSTFLSSSLVFQVVRTSDGPPLVVCIPTNQGLTFSALSG